MCIDQSTSFAVFIINMSTVMIVIIIIFTHTAIIFPGDASSYVTLRIHGGIIDGCYYTQSMMYHVEPSSRYFIQPLPFHSLIYRSKDVDFNLSTVKTIGHHVNVRSFTKPVS